ncbi:hypothetical protein DDV21_001075 [Streptococcus chenjunshii]|uniref:Uncharacterized protein n=1 Tax=Streptococcus chenjunshii TaxID=2173853 RepID=A0A372KKC7_9STRE|nr:hypothetical protein DDV21_001075 [Streptococcus chenjunshii]RFU50485.1 hypothetical protein DDV22_08410 [Streptococcus chenjunshii]RFU52713.1 hypothetical protein DDV23_08250 [Streptococcus chenjunshii]
MKGNLGYYKKSYRRVYENFIFSVGIYRSNTVLLKRLCQESLKELDRLNRRFMEQDKVSTYYLLKPYSEVIKRFYLSL